MAIPDNCVRTNIVWKLPGNEIAVNTLHFRHLHQIGQPLDWEGDMLQRYANLVIDGLTDSWGSLRTFHYQGAKIERVDAYLLDTSGHAIAKKTAVPHQDTPLEGSGSGGQLPAEVSLAISLFAYDPAGFTPRSATKRGRLYLPAVSQTRANSEGRVNNPQEVATAWAAALSYMQNRQMGNNLPGVPDETAQLVVLSKTAGAAYGIVFVRVDDLFDTQKRRQNALTPVRALAAVA